MHAVPVWQGRHLMAPLSLACIHISNLTPKEFDAILHVFLARSIAHAATDLLVALCCQSQPAHSMHAGVLSAQLRLPNSVAATNWWP